MDWDLRLVGSAHGVPWAPQCLQWKVRHTWVGTLPSAAARLVMCHGQLSPYSPHTLRGDCPCSGASVSSSRQTNRTFPCALMLTPCDHPPSPISLTSSSPSLDHTFSHVKPAYAMPRPLLHPCWVAHSRSCTLLWVHQRNVTPIYNHWFQRSLVQTGHGATQLEVSTWLSSPQTIPVRPLGSLTSCYPHLTGGPTLSVVTPSC